MSGIIIGVWKKTWKGGFVFTEDHWIIDGERIDVTCIMGNKFIF